MALASPKVSVSVKGKAANRFNAASGAPRGRSSRLTQRLTPKPPLNHDARYAFQRVAPKPANNTGPTVTATAPKEQPPVFTAPKPKKKAEATLG